MALEVELPYSLNGVAIRKIYLLYLITYHSLQRFLFEIIEQQLQDEAA